MIPLAQFTDADATRTIVKALRLLAVMVAIAAPLLAWKLGWQTAVLFLVGAAISAASLWKWLRLMVATLARMEVPADGVAPAPVRPMAPVLMGFFLTLGLSVVALYVSLRYLDGSVYALAAGLALGVFALVIEALRLVKAWTV
jgi:hypothetical protein